MGKTCFKCGALFDSNTRPYCHYSGLRSQSAPICVPPRLFCKKCGKEYLHIREKYIDMFLSEMSSWMGHETEEVSDD